MDLRSFPPYPHHARSPALAIVVARSPAFRGIPGYSARSFSLGPAYLIPPLHESLLFLMWHCPSLAWQGGHLHYSSWRANRMSPSVVYLRCDIPCLHSRTRVVAVEAGIGCSTATALEERGLVGNPDFACGGARDSRRCSKRDSRSNIQRRSRGSGRGRREGRRQ